MENNNELKMIFVCSPFRGVGETVQEAKENFMKNQTLARQACRYVIGKGSLPCCPHLYCPQFLRDIDPDERELGMLMGQMWLAECDELWVFGRKISPGMKREIALAKKWGIPVKHFIAESERTFEERLLDAILRSETDCDEEN